MRTVVCNFKDEIAFLSSFPSVFQGHRKREVSPQPRPSPGSVRVHYPPSWELCLWKCSVLFFSQKRAWNSYSFTRCWVSWSVKKSKLPLLSYVPHTVFMVLLLNFWVRPMVCLLKHWGGRLWTHPSDKTLGRKVCDARLSTESHPNCAILTKY